MPNEYKMLYKYILVSTLTCGFYGFNLIDCFTHVYTDDGSSKLLTQAYYFK